MNDVFISYASEDKWDIAYPLANELSNRGLSVWYDDFVLQIGDSLRSEISRGLSDSKYGVIILSPNFFRKNWTRYELDGLTSKEMFDGNKTILPIWHRVSYQDVLMFSPSLADKLAIDSGEGISSIADKIMNVIRPTIVHNDSFELPPLDIFTKHDQQDDNYLKDLKEQGYIEVIEARYKPDYYPMVEGTFWKKGKLISTDLMPGRDNWEIPRGNKSKGIDKFGDLYLLWTYIDDNPDYIRFGISTWDSYNGYEAISEDGYTGMYL